MERDVRIAVVNTILQTPHRELAPLVPIHKEAEEHDPLFYIKFALWYAKNGTIRDHLKVFAAQVITSQFSEFRGIGQTMLSEMSPRDIKKTVELCFNNFNGATGAKRRRLRTTVEEVLRGIEKDSRKDDGRRILRNTKALRALYIMLRIGPGSDEIAKSLKFKARAGAKPLPIFGVIRQIAENKHDEALVCELIHKHRVPVLVAVSLVPEITPAIAAAIVEGLSHQEVINYMTMFERRGLLDNPGFKRLIEQKLKKTPKSKSASMRSSKGAKAMKKHGDLLDTATDDFVASLPAINRKIVLAIDKSFSMNRAIALGKDVATILAAKVTNPKENLHVCVFDSTVRDIDVTGKDAYSKFEAQFRYIRANGTTSLGAVIDHYVEKDINPDCILFITDAEETQVPFLEQSLVRSSGLAGCRLINCKVGDNTYDLSVSPQTVRSLSLEVENIDYDGDYYSLPNLVKLVSSGGIKGLIAEIDSIDLSEYIG